MKSIHTLTTCSLPSSALFDEGTRCVQSQPVLYVLQQYLQPPQSLLTMGRYTINTYRGTCDYVYSVHALHCNRHFNSNLFLSKHYVWTFVACLQGTVFHLQLQLCVDYCHNHLQPIKQNFFDKVGSTWSHKYPHLHNFLSVCGLH